MNIKKAKGTNKCVIKRKLIFENYINSLLNDKIILQSQQRFKSDHHNVYTKEINRIPLSSNDGKRLQTFYRITMYPYGMEQNAKASLEKTININDQFGDYTNENKTQHNSKWPYFPDQSYRILIIGGSGSRKTNALLNLINNQPALIKYICMLRIRMKRNINF